MGLKIDKEYKKGELVVCGSEIYRIAEDSRAGSHYISAAFISDGKKVKIHQGVSKTKTILSDPTEGQPEVGDIVTLRISNPQDFLTGAVVAIQTNPPKVVVEWTAGSDMFCYEFHEIAIVKKASSGIKPIPSIFKVGDAVKINCTSHYNKGAEATVVCVIPSGLIDVEASDGTRCCNLKPSELIKVEPKPDCKIVVGDRVKINCDSNSLLNGLYGKVVSFHCYGQVARVTPDGLGGNYQFTLKELIKQKLDIGSDKAKGQVYLTSDCHFGHVLGGKVLEALNSWESMLKKEKDAAACSVKSNVQVKENSMKPITVETRVFVNNTDVTTLDNPTLYGLIKSQEQEIDNLNSIKNKPDRLNEEIKKRQEGIDALVKLLNERDAKK